MQQVLRTTVLDQGFLNPTVHTKYLGTSLKSASCFSGSWVSLRAQISNRLPDAARVAGPGLYFF